MEERLQAIDDELTPPEYYVARRIANEAQQRAISLKPPSAPADNISPLDCGEIRDDWLEQMVNQQAEQQLHEKRRGVLLTLARDAQSRANNLAGGNSPAPRLAAYDRLLQQLLEEVAELADDLRGVRTATQALQKDRGPQWKQLTCLTADYNTLRRCQLSLIDNETQISATAQWNGAEPHASDLFLKNLDSLWPDWRAPKRDNLITLNNPNAPRPRPEPWPADDERLLLWLATSRAQPWIPTPAQLHQLWADRRNRANPMPTTEPKRRGPVQRLAPFQRTAKTITSTS
jgi:hypothetical protein